MIFNLKFFLLTDLRERTVGEALSHTSKKVVGLFNPGLGHIWEATDECSSLSKNKNISLGENKK